MEFLRMGGYGTYVWSAYGITLVILVVNIWWTYRFYRKSRETLREISGNFSKHQPTVRKTS